ncbi:MAG: 4Fe-4S binding protein [Candidatus Hodarchaeota archaeon]
MKVNEKLCIKCGKCVEYCPTWKYDYQTVRKKILARS